MIVRLRLNIIKNNKRECLIIILLNKITSYILRNMKGILYVFDILLLPIYKRININQLIILNK